MPALDVAPPPTLLLPDHALVRADEAIAQALSSLARADGMEWVSAAADACREELAGLAADLRALAAHVDEARDDWARLRWLAAAHGQL